jgi:DNA-binding SARP family transcriptional activator
VARLGAALHLWRGPPLADLAGLTWLESQAERLTTLRLDALDAVIGARLALGEHTELVTELTELTRQHPYRENLHGQLMLALYRAGRQADALVVYRRLRQHLAEDLGIDPGSAVRTWRARSSGTTPCSTPAGQPGAAGGPPEGLVPRQLPSDVFGFTGRTGYLAEWTRFSS